MIRPGEVAPGYLADRNAWVAREAASGVPVRDLALYFGVTPNRIRQIVGREARRLWGEAKRSSADA